MVVVLTHNVTVLIYVGVPHIPPMREVGILCGSGQIGYWKATRLQRKAKLAVRRLSFQFNKI
jgi:hypothetical protein